MNKTKITEYDYINFLIGTQLVYSNTEAEQVCPHEKDGAAHDAYMRQLYRLIPTTERLWSEARKHIDLNKGVLIIDNSTLDKSTIKRLRSAQCCKQLVSADFSRSLSCLIAGTPV